MGAKLTKEFRNFKEAIFDTFPALDSFMSKLGKALTIGPGSLDKFTRLVVMGQQPPEEGGGEANLDEIIKDQTNLITDLEASFKGLSIYATTAIIGFSNLFENANLTLEEYIKNVETFLEGYASYYDRIEAGEIPGGAFERPSGLVECSFLVVASMEGCRSRSLCGGGRV
jgi:hypothetical protein